MPPRRNTQANSSRAERSLAALRVAMTAYAGGDHAGALKQIRAVLKADPSNAEAHRLCAHALLAVNDKDRARAHAERAVALAPAAAPAHTTLGTVLDALDDPERALASMQRAVELNPSDPEALTTLAIRLDARQAYDESLPLHERAIAAAKPGSASAIHARMNAALALLNAARARDAVDLLTPLVSAHPDQPLIAARLAYCLNYDDRATRVDIDAAHRRWGTLVERSSSRAPFDARGPQSDTDRTRVRVALVSPDLRAHSVSNFLGSLLDHLDRDRFELHAWFTSRHADEMTEQLRPRFDRWHDAPGVRDADLVRSIRNENIDIAIDLSGHFAGHRLGAFAAGLAPLQLTWLGYPATTGLSRIHARLVDRLTDPESLDDQTLAPAERPGEALARIEPCFLCYDPPQASIPVAKSLLSASGEPFTFGSFNDTKKLNPTTFEMWAAILKQVPNSRLLLKAAPLGADAVRTIVTDAFASRGVSADRLELLGPSGTRNEHLEAYRRVDLALDPFPYHGTTTTCEALWMGVPVLTRFGDDGTGTHASRVGLSLLTGTGLPELCTPDASAYIAKATELATQPESLISIRAGLRERFLASAVCDAPRFAERFGSALLDLYDAHRGEDTPCP